MQSLLYFVSRVRCRRKESSRSLSHLLMSFLLPLPLFYVFQRQADVEQSFKDGTEVSRVAYRYWNQLLSDFVSYMHWSSCFLDRDTTVVLNLRLFREWLSLLCISYSQRNMHCKSSSFRLMPSTGWFRKKYTNTKIAISHYSEIRDISCNKFCSFV